MIHLEEREIIEFNKCIEGSELLFIKSELDALGLLRLSMVISQNLIFFKVGTTALKCIYRVYIKIIKNSLFL